MAKLMHFVCVHPVSLGTTALYKLVKNTTAAGNCHLTVTYAEFHGKML